MEYAICTVPAAPLRKEDAHRTEMTSQILFGETVQVLEQKGEWFRVRGIYDDYEGWLTHHLIEEIAENMATAEVCFTASEMVNYAFKDNQQIIIPLGASLTGYEKEERTLWSDNIQYKGAFANFDEVADANRLEQIARMWLNAPYLWGGKTLMGVDCSGFVQTTCKVAGIKLKRDAWQQATQGEPVNNLAETQKGDIAFFQNDNGRVTHVGILLDNNKIIHASGKVRIDNLDEQGITNVDSGARTHTFHSIRRFY